MSNVATPHIAIVAGEVSGDILGAGLIKALKQQYPNARFSGVAGPLMIEQGCETLYPMDTLSVMGLVEVLGRIVPILKMRRALIQHYLETPPDVFIGIDAPDFNLDLELKLHSNGIKTLHYVSPSVWAWKQKRVFKIKQACNKILVFLPFEKAFYDRFDVPCDFVGHTMADDIELHTPKTPARQNLGLDDSRPTLALMPGSRKAEIELLSPVFLETVERLSQHLPDLQVVVPLVNAKCRAQFEAIVAQYPSNLSLTLVDGNARAVLSSADAVLLASGTASLEAMLVKRPMVIAYRFKPLTYQIAKRIVNAKFAGLPNLLADEMIVPECIQDECNAERLAYELLPLFTQDQSALIQRFTQLHQLIRCDADQKAASAVRNVLESSND
ncbi:lipid-A-disaccharide synthase [Alginatibacterium sediminis]|uniref:Lipid-A-disaccharide synthase n=1 Tax=Alginatibacterium sediminis TaxID=2164068 RepID=A0A420E7Z8_9ALTE|nr:lipid-A-disaccharide synthase [Alginatibacterium sediminis]RKF15500.1 lipid-A-disaccharide synthase [Alginatibacterium sediminis]